MQQIQEQQQQLSERTFRRSRLTERLRELYQIDEALKHLDSLYGAALRFTRSPSDAGAVAGRGPRPGSGGDCSGETPR